MKTMRILLLSTMAVTSAISGFARSRADVPSEAIAMEDSITRIYHKLAGDLYDQDFYGFDAGLTWFQRGIFNLEELASDESKWLWDPDVYGGINYGNVPADLPVILGPWLGMTRIVDLCNSFINHDFQLDRITDGSQRSEALHQREEYIRQAKILRSAMYFYLLNEYGNVPYSDETTGTDGTPRQLSTDMATGRRLVTEKVISTLEEIVEWYKTNDSENKPVYGHVGLDAAEALLVKFYLNNEIFTGSPAWSQTLAHANSIIERRGKGGFRDSGLAMNYSQNFSYNNRTAAENEIIWRIATKDPDGTDILSYSNGSFMMMANIGNSYGEYNPIVWKESEYNSQNGWKCLVGLRQLTDMFEWNYETKESPDQRVAWWGTTKQGFDPHNYSLSGQDWGSNGFIPVKFTNWNIKDDGNVDTADVPPRSPEPYCIDYGMIRLAEIYLSAAEAILHGAGDSSDALKYVNFIRERAGMPPFATLDMETLQAERQRELYTECNRRTDLIRYGKWISGYNWNWKGGARTGRDYDPNFIVYPIPASIVEKYGYVQNPLASMQEIEPVGNTPAEWKIIGSFCDFDADKGIVLQSQGDGSYTLTMPELKGAFSFIAGDPWDGSTLGNGSLDAKLYGNIDIDLSVSGEPIETEGKLSNVRLVLYPYAQILMVEGLAENQTYTGFYEKSVPIYLRGDVNEWNANNEYKMTYEGDGMYSLKVEELSGGFKFADRGWNTINFGARQTDQILGNCTVGVRNQGYYNFYAPVVLKNVEIHLDTKTRTVSFSGLPNTQEIPPYDPNVQQYGYFLLDKEIDYIASASYTDEGDEALLEVRNMSAGSGCYISKTNLIAALPIYERRNAILKYLYSEKDGSGMLADGAEISLNYPASDLSSGWFEFEEDGTYRLRLDPATDMLRVERFDPSIYIVGDVWSENEVYNGFLTPSMQNKEIYDREFTLSKEGEVYKGRFRLGSYKEAYYDIDRLPQFRFFTKLVGWSNEYSLGSAPEDFYCLAVPLGEGGDYWVYDQGMGNWGFDAPDKWINITLDLKNMRVKFRLDGDDSEVNEIEVENEDSKPVWFNMQGIRVEKPSKGVYIKVNGAKKSKVVF